MSYRLGVVGFGVMGSEIALLGACAGMDVTVLARDVERIEEGKVRLGKVLRLLARDPKFFAAGQVADEEGRNQVLARIESSHEYTALAGCDAVVESVPENMDSKREVFSELSAHCNSSALLITNTSSISISGIAEAVAEQARVVGMHFFNPPSQMQLVEVIPGQNTSEESVASALELVAKLGKQGVRVKDTPGFVVNRVLLAMMNEAIALAEEGVAGVADIDEAMKLGAGFPLGPFKLADLVGLDVCLHTLGSIHRELGRETFRPRESLKRHVEAGRLGRKSKEGFYKY